MTKLKLNLKWPVVGTLKPSVQKRGPRDSIGFISKRLIPLYFRFLSWVFSQDKKSYSLFSSRILLLWSKNGNTFLVKYLKDAYLKVQLYVSGTKVTPTQGVPLALKGGLPRIIPGPLRKEIRLGNPLVIRAVLTSLAVFRIIKCEGTLKLSSITDPFKGSSPVLPDYEISLALRSLFGKPFSLRDMVPIQWLFLMTAGPNSSISWKGTLLDIKAWSSHPLLPTLLDYIIEVGQMKTRFWKTLLEELDRTSTWNIMKTLYLGRLSLKEEAAGKIRVFAITDSVTQAVLKPLHKFIFSLLKKLSTDGTFNQGLPLLRLMDLKRNGELGSNSFWSYDLSAATDRLPLALQSQILNLLFSNTKIGTLWGQLLSNRDWYLKSSDIQVRYSVGQPMGALSSWGMLALSHHVIVQIAARRVGIKEFNHYALLGDDIVIASDVVAQSYFSLMVDTLGVDNNLSKSLVSQTHLEFAKRLVSVDHELTPLGPKNLLLLLRSPNGIISVLRDVVLKGLLFSELICDNMLKSVPYYRSRSWASLQWALKGPFGLVPTEAGLSSKIRLNNSLTSVAVDQLISAIDQIIHNDNYESWSKDLITYNRVIKEWESNVWIPSEYEGFPNSDLYFYMREILMNQESRLLGKKPVRRFIFDGPLIHFGFYAPQWLETVMSYIISKIHSGTTYVPSMDPFKDLSLSIPERNITRGDKFFKKVYYEWEERKKVPRSYF